LGLRLARGCLVRARARARARAKFWLTGYIGLGGEALAHGLGLERSSSPRPG